MACAILRQFEMRGCWPLNESVAIGRSRDKLRSLQILAKHGLGLPLTAYANDPKQAEEIIRAVKGPPVVIKLIEGTQGIGVVLAETHEQRRKSVIEALRGLNVNILVQEFIKEAGGTDIRALVVGGKVVAAMKRTGAADDFVPTSTAAAAPGDQDHTGRTINRGARGQAHGAERVPGWTCCAAITAR